MQLYDCERGLELRPRLNASPVCDAQCHPGGICGWRRYISERYLTIYLRLAAKSLHTYIHICLDTYLMWPPPLCTAHNVAAVSDSIVERVGIEGRWVHQ